MGWKQYWYKYLTPVARIQLLRLWLRIKNLLNQTFDIQRGTDAQGTIENIRKNVALRGANVWILICGAMLASIGLDTNSAAVIIGAMLISPLMNPILGIGLAVGINDRNLLITSLRHFLIAVGASLLTSFLYFLITPLGEITEELLARTQPTLLDVLIALFGGIAGIVANSRKEATNAIPGVAIATALMPPVCTAGFGLAKSHWSIFLGALYLFFINAVFISLATFLIVRYLHFPQTSFATPLQKQQVKRFITLFVLLTILPSIFILYKVVHQLHEKKQIETFLETYLHTANTRVLSWEIQKQDSVRLLKVFLGGKALTQDSIQKIVYRFKKEVAIKDLRLQILQTGLPPDVETQLKTEIREQILSAIKVNQEILNESQKTIDSLQRILQQVLADTFPLWQLSREIQVFTPKIDTIAMAKLQIKLQDTLVNLPSLWLPNVDKILQKRLATFIKVRLKLDTLVIIPSRES